MTTSASYKFNCFVEDLAEKKHNLGSDQLRVALVAAANAPSASGDAVIADLTEISYSNCSSRDLTTVSSGQTGGVYSLVLADLPLTSSGGSVGPFRYAVVYNSTASGGPLCWWYDYGSDITLGDGDSIVLDVNAAGVFTLT